MASDAVCKFMQDIATDLPEIAQRIIEKAEKFIGEKEFEHAT